MSIKVQVNSSSNYKIGISDSQSNPARASQINSTGNYRVGVSDQQRPTVRTVNVIPLIPTNQLANLTDVDSTGLSEGDSLVYNETTGKFETKQIEIIAGGTF